MGNFASDEALTDFHQAWKIAWIQALLKAGLLTFNS